MALNHGIIGNGTAAALVKENAAIEWCCLPKFDSPSVFAKLLDTKRGGSFEIHPLGGADVQQQYLENTNVLETTFTTQDGKYKVLDYFPLYKTDTQLVQRNVIHRIVKVIHGNPKIRVVYNPQLKYARGTTTVSIEDECIVARNEGDTLYLQSNAQYNAILEQKPITLGHDLYFLLSFNQQPASHAFIDIESELKHTQRYWQEYVADRTIPASKWKAQVIRSVLTLKLLTYHKTGAVIAAATTSLPEIAGANRNWDYRYCWLRDASFAIDALTKTCSFSEARKFIQFVMDICTECAALDFNLGVVYGVEGKSILPEETLDHLVGYKHSRPVRIGNAAYTQMQIDVLGEVAEALYHFYITYNYVQEMTDEQFNFIRDMANHVVNHWRDKDHGIWEFRDMQEHFVHSKVMSWVALDRAIRIAEHYDKDCPLDQWKHERDTIHAEVLEYGWNEDKQAFTMFYGSNDLDAAVLLMYHYGFISPDDRRFKQTVKAIDTELREDCFVYRYLRTDDFGTPQNPFLVCSFWLMDALHGIGKKDKAQRLCDQFLEHTNHLGLLSEDFDREANELIGNFPQAYTHLALVNTIIRLSEQYPDARPVCTPQLEGSP